MMKFKIKYKFCLWKSYLDKGMSLTNYFKYLIAFFALASNNILLTLWIGISYGFLSLAVGYLWFRYDFIKAEKEVENQYNLFVKEVRKSIKTLKK